MKFEFVMPTPEPQASPEAEPEASPTRPSRDSTPRPGKALKAKSMRAHLQERQDWQRKGNNFTGRNAVTRRKKVGPGCRGVR
jgi:hypothetical protein